LALVVLFGFAWSGIRLMVLFGASSAWIMLCLYRCSDSIMSYVGMSGVLYTLAVYGGITTFLRQKIIAGFVLVYVAVKLFAHDWMNAVMGVDQLLDNLHVMTDVHLHGAVFGLVAASFSYKNKK